MMRHWTKGISEANALASKVGRYTTVDRVHTVDNTEAGCEAPIVQQYDNGPYAARVRLTRAVDADKEDHMAQRSTALPAPVTPTPTS